MWSLLLLLLQLSLLHRTDGFLSFTLNRCVFNSSDLRDIEHVYSVFYNKLEVVRFSSSLGRFVGFTAFGVKQAEAWNRNRLLLALRRNEKKRFCLHNVRVDYESSLSRSVRPTVRLHSVSPPAGPHPAMLVCSVYGFYPRQVRVSWLRNQREVTEGVTSTAELPDADWFYQVHSHLEFTARPAETITCVVEHISLEEPVRIDWDEASADSRSLAVIGASGLTMCLLLSFAASVLWNNLASSPPLVTPHVLLSH